MSSYGIPGLLVAKPPAERTNVRIRKAVALAQGVYFARAAKSTILDERGVINIACPPGWVTAAHLAHYLTEDMSTAVDADVIQECSWTLLPQISKSRAK